MTTLSRPTFGAVPLRRWRFMSQLATAILLLAVLLQEFGLNARRCYAGWLTSGSFPIQ